MDNRLLDVSIGLVLVFALTSLLASILLGLLQNVLKSRGKVLTQAVSSMFGDDDKLAQMFYCLPLIRTLYRNDRHPSYLEPDLFCSALFDLLGRHVPEANLVRGNGTPQDFVVRLSTVLAQKFPEQASGLGAATGLVALGGTLQTLAAGAADWPAFETRITQWFTATTDRASGWFTRQSQIWLFGIGFVLALAMNINPIRIGEALWRDPVLRAAMVESARSITQENTALVQAAAVASAAAAAEKLNEKPAPQAASKPADGSAFSDKQFNALRALLRQDDGSSGVALQLMIGAAHLKAAVDAERDARKMPVHADGMLEQLAAITDRQLADLGNRAKAAAQHKGTGTAADIGIAAADQLALIEQGIANERYLDGLTRAPKAVASAPVTAPSSAPAVDCSGVVAAAAYVGDKVYHADAASDVARANPQTEDLSWAAGKLCALGIPMGWQTNPPAPPWTPQPTQALFYWVAMIAGFLIAAAACTLGAQFWFDLLTKLVNMRGSGNKPVEGADASKPVTTASSGQVGGVYASPAPAARAAGQQGGEQLGQHVGEVLGRAVAGAVLTPAPTPVETPAPAPAVVPVGVPVAGGDVVSYAPPAAEPDAALDPTPSLPSDPAPKPSPTPALLLPPAAAVIAAITSLTPAPSQLWLNVVEETLTADSVKVEAVQLALGMAKGAASGILDGATREAIRAWHLANNRGSSTELSVLDLVTLLGRWP
ncbi:hypothetical protein [Amantichitinum ursilacus]|uniref:Peptidoglycan binding domain protein n=1 Tax=Amantichitinum ursilacus TaxID=857265 RepID=A0A0N0GNJ8_9NEIS|nr:hypothetical protein [Amantichitinum ursilacus]KPC52603.1 hypothetical protein WG78_12185 [Amantichitinum ursilacus]